MTIKREVVPVVAILAVVGSVWYFSDVIMNYGVADAECVKFAEETQTNIAFDVDPDDKKIFVAKKWIKNGQVVVELGQRTAKKGYFQSRLCVVGGGHISLPSMFEQWEYR